MHCPFQQVAQLSKFEEGGGLGISLEGTVDVEGGREVRPHHYIRSILPDGPVGKNGRLQSGDELLEVRRRLDVMMSKVLHDMNETEPFEGILQLKITENNRCNFLSFLMSFHLKL